MEMYPLCGRQGPMTLSMVSWEAGRARAGGRARGRILVV